MWPFDDIAAAASKAADTATNAVSDAANTVANAVQSAVDTVAKGVEQAASAVDDAATAVGDAAQGALDSARGWVNDNWGETPLGAVGRAVIDGAKVAVAVTEFVVHVAAAAAALGAGIGRDIAHGNWGDVPARFDSFGKRVESHWKEAVEDMNTFAIASSAIGREVHGIKKLHAKSWSVAARLSRTKKDFPDPRTYRTTGERYEFQLNSSGAVEFRVCSMTCDEPEWQPLVDPMRGVPTMMSFNSRRLGDRARQPDGTVAPFRDVPPFECIVASADRVFAKEQGKDNFYFLLMDELFWGPPELRQDDDLDQLDLLSMPSNYAKLDPEKNLSSAKKADLAAALAGNLPKIPQAERHPVLVEAMNLGVMPMMIVKVAPRVWFMLDTRPPHDSQADIPKDLPTYPHATYGSQTTLIGGLSSSIESSIDFEHVLDIGVGNCHFHEQWTDVYGGDMRNTRLEYFQNLAVGEFNYSILNGPLSDGDHFADGTCNFYILVRLRDSKRHVVLYCDEQTLFTQRWRLADPRDNAPVEFSKMNFSLAAALDDSRDGLMHGFRADHFWSPFGDVYLNATSRMSVARTVIVLSGQDPKSGNHELYSLNFGYGVSDRTWRWRNLSERFHVRLLDAFDIRDGTTSTIDRTHSWTPVVFPQTLHVREDMMITLRGTAPRGDETIHGVWAQSYLPADCRQVPSNSEHEAAHRLRTQPEKPARGFEHPWTFWSDQAFRLADRFSHLGVYADVDSRVQYYELDIVGELPPEDSDAVWTYSDDPPDPTSHPHAVTVGELYIKARKLNWKAVAQQLKELQRAFLVSARNIAEWVADHHDELLLKWEETPPTQAAAEAQLRASRRSMYNHAGRFRLGNRGPLGWIAMWADLRDDDLISLSDLPVEVTLRRDEDPTQTVRVRFKRNRRVYTPPVVQHASVALRTSRSAATVDVTVQTDRTPHELDVNIWRLHLAAVDCDAEGIVVPLLSDIDWTELEPRSPGTYAASIPVESSWAQQHAKYFGEDGRLAYGTSLWFENVVGQVACPEELKLAVAGGSGPITHL